ncbi:putative ATP-grasp target RiPP [Kitasatospora sp. MAP12-15]|nr:putative ATP-grasp target RiPP [Kitasatospora sp. MAP12-44]
MENTLVPWGIGRMGPFVATTTVPAFMPVIDPETQIAVIVDETAGRSNWERTAPARAG